MQNSIPNEHHITSSNGIDDSAYVALGGIEQWIYIRGHDRSKPVLLFLHGGPGQPFTFLTYQFANELENHFVVVHWDQRGAGKSYRSDMSADSITKELLAKDAAELIEYLRQRFSVDKVFLAGHSFGSIIGALTARDHPERIHAFVGISQVVHAMRMEEYIYNFDVKRARELGNQEAITELESISLQKFQAEDIFRTRKWLAQFGGITFSDGDLSEYMKPALQFPFYSKVDYDRTMSYGVIGMNAGWYQKHWLDEKTGVNLMAQVPRIDVPVFFFLGRHDHLAPTEIVSEYMHLLKAPSKEIVWFEHSGHYPYLEEPAKFQSALIAKLLRKA